MNSGMKVSIVTRLVVSFLIACGTGQFVSAQRLSLSRVNVRLVTDEAEAMLSILAKKKANEPITDAEWRRLKAKVTLDSNNVKLPCSVHLKTLISRHSFFLIPSLHAPWRFSKHSIAGSTRTSRDLRVWR